MLKEIVFEKLNSKYEITEENIGDCSDLSNKGMNFHTQSYEIKNLGHLCVMTMNAFFGIMKMETVVLTVNTRDVPLLNLDRIKVLGNETLLCELYDTQLSPYSSKALDRLKKVSERDFSIQDYVSSANGFSDTLIYPCSYRKKGKKATDRFTRAASDFFEIFVDELDSLSECDSNLKKQKNAEFANALYSKGGSAVNQVKKLFGDDIAKKLVVNYMYGIK